MEQLKMGALCIGILSLTGCVLVWGKAYKVEFSDSTSITMEYDPALTDIGDLQNVAESHCSHYGKDAVPGFAMHGMGVALQDVTFDCRKPDP